MSLIKNREQLAGHLAVGGAYVIFGLNVVCCKDIANSALVSPMVLFTLRAAGASALFWLLSLFLPKEKVERADFPRIALASFLGLFLTQVSLLMGIAHTSAIDAAIMGTLGPIFTMIFAFCEGAHYREESRRRGAQLRGHPLPHFQLRAFRRRQGHGSLGNCPAAY